MIIRISNLAHQNFQVRICVCKPVLSSGFKLPNGHNAAILTLFATKEVIQQTNQLVNTNDETLQKGRFGALQSEMRRDSEPLY